MVTGIDSMRAVKDRTTYMIMFLIFKLFADSRDLQLTGLYVFVFYIWMFIFIVQPGVPVLLQST